MRDLARLWSEKRFHERQFPYLAFDPMGFQRALLEKRAKIRIAYGANRGGKTLALATDLVQIATNSKHLLYPSGWPRTTGPKRIWAIFLDANKARDTGIRKIRDAIGVHVPFRWREADQEFRLANGTVIAIKSQESGFTKAQSADIDHAWFDEQPDERYFREVMARLIDRNGTATVSVTFIEGISWLYTAYIEPWLEATNGQWIEHEGVLCASTGMKDNLYLDRKAVADYEKTIYDPAERLIRVEGRVVSLTGLVFPNFDGKRHIFNCLDSNGNCTFRLPEGWRAVRAMDWGIKHPHPCVWIAKDPQAGQLHVYREYFERERPIDQICQQVITRSPAHEKYEADLLDPACWNRAASLLNPGIGDFITLAHLYQQFGIPVVRGSRDEPVRIQIMRRLLGNPEEAPGVLFHACCRNTIREHRRWQYRGVTQKPEDEKNDTVDATGYGIAYFETEAGTSGPEWAETGPNSYIDAPPAEPEEAISRPEAFMQKKDDGSFTIGIRARRQGRAEWEHDQMEWTE